MAMTHIVVSMAMLVKTADKYNDNKGNDAHNNISTPNMTVGNVIATTGSPLLFCNGTFSDVWVVVSVSVMECSSTVVYTGVPVWIVCISC